MRQDESELISKGPCSGCGSSDACCLYSDGHTYCFSCSTYGRGEDDPQPQQRRTRMAGLLPLGETRALPARGLTLQTSERWGYTISKLNGQPIQLANYRDSTTREIVMQKGRTEDKDFPKFGNTKHKELYGRWLWKDTGRRVIITEGEHDAHSVDQVLGYKWQTVSLTNGIDGAVKDIKNNLDWLLGFDEIVLSFDMDEPGRRGVEAVAGLFPPGRVFVVSLPLKDANEMLKAGRTEELVRALWGPKGYRPDGIVTVSDIRESINAEPQKDLSWCFPYLDLATFGRRWGESTAIGAGTGVGKTTFITQQAAHDMNEGHKVCIFAFEATPAELVKRIAGVNAGRQFHLPGDWTAEELETAVAALAEANDLYLYDHFGACDWEVVKQRIRFLRHTHGVRVFFLDHLTALAAAADDERTALEKIMAEIGSLVKELGIWLGFVSHLATPEGTPHEEGGRVKLRHFKGSRAIGYWAHDAIGLERDQQAEDAEEREITIYRILKCRANGSATGKTIRIRFDPATGRLTEAPEVDFEDDDDGPF
jgi:twinkle protein